MGHIQGLTNTAPLGHHSPTRKRKKNLNIFPFFHTNHCKTMKMNQATTILSGFPAVNTHSTHLLTSISWLLFSVRPCTTVLQLGINLKDNKHKLLKETLTFFQSSKSNIYFYMLFEISAGMNCKPRQWLHYIYACSENVTWEHCHQQGIKDLFDSSSCCRLDLAGWPNAYWVPMVTLDIVSPRTGYLKTGGLFWLRKMST